MISSTWLTLLAFGVLTLSVVVSAVPVPANTNNANGNTNGVDDPDYGSTNGLDKRLAALFDALPDSSDTNTFDKLNMSAIIDGKNTTLGQLLNSFPELLDYNGTLNPTQLKHVIKYYLMEPTDYWAREKLVVEYLSDLPEELKMRLPPPVGFRTTDPIVREKIRNMMYQPTSSGSTFWDKVLNVARYIQSLVPEVVEFKVNTTLQLNGRYTRTALKQTLTDEQFKQIDLLQRNKSMEAEQRQTLVGAKLREFYKLKQEQAKEKGEEEASWPAMLNNEDLPPLVQTAVRHIWLDEQGGKNLRPIYEVFATHVKPNILPKEFNRRRGLAKTCVYEPLDVVKAREAQQEIDRLKADPTSASLFAYGQVGDYTPTIQPAITEQPTTVQAVLVQSGGDGQLEVKKLDPQQKDALNKADMAKGVEQEIAEAKKAKEAVKA